VLVISTLARTAHISRRFQCRLLQSASSAARIAGRLVSVGVVAVDAATLSCASRPSPSESVRCDLAELFGDSLEQPAVDRHPEHYGV
jgi:hypothetical protein